jgi:hypothetical protein
MSHERNNAYRASRTDRRNSLGRIPPAAEFTCRIPPSAECGFTAECTKLRTVEIGLRSATTLLLEKQPINVNLLFACCITKLFAIELTCFTASVNNKSHAETKGMTNTVDLLVVLADDGAGSFVVLLLMLSLRPLRHSFFRSFRLSSPQSTRLSSPVPRSQMLSSGPVSACFRFVHPVVGRRSSWMSLVLVLALAGSS